jgi:hypothetical protein
MTYVHRIRKPKVGTFTSLLRQLSQEQLLSLYELPTADQARLPGCTRGKPLRLRRALGGASQA